jgi:hypothetical protein
VRSTRMQWSALLAIGVGLPAFAGDANSVDVRVLIDGQQCVVNHQAIRCDDVGDHLRRTLHTKPDQLIQVSIDGTARSHERGHRIAELNRRAGYPHIIMVAFITEPGDDGRPR